MIKLLPSPITLSLQRFSCRPVLLGLSALLLVLCVYRTCDSYLNYVSSAQPSTAAAPAAHQVPQPPPTKESQLFHLPLHVRTAVPPLNIHGRLDNAVVASANKTGLPKQQLNRRIIKVDETLDVILLASSPTKFTSSLTSLLTSHFRGRVHVVCYTSINDMCDRIEEIAQQLLAEKKRGGESTMVMRRLVVGGTALIRTSGQLLMAASLTVIEDLHQKSDDYMIVADADNVVWCDNPLRSLVNSHISSRDAVYTLTAMSWSADVTRTVESWSASLNRGGAAKGGGTNMTLISGSFFCGTIKNIHRMVRSAVEAFRNFSIPENVPMTVLLSNVNSHVRVTLNRALDNERSFLDALPRGQILTPMDAINQNTSGRQQKCTSVVSDLSFCPSPNSGGGVPQDGTCDQSAGMYTLYPAQEETTLLRSLVKHLPTAIRGAWVGLRHEWGGAATKQLLLGSRRQTAGSFADATDVPDLTGCAAGQHTILGFTWSLDDPSPIVPVIESFSALPNLTANCTRLVLLVRTPETWMSVIPSTVKPFVSLESTQPYEVAHRCSEIGPEACRHSVLRQWVVDHLVPNSTQITNDTSVNQTATAPQAAAIGLLMILDLLPGRRVVLHVDPFEQLMVAENHDILQLLRSDKDFLVMPTVGGGAAAVMEVAQPFLYNYQRASLVGVFGTDFSNSVLPLTLGDLQTSTASAKKEPIPVPSASVIIGTPRAIALYLRLLDVTLSTRKGSSGSHSAQRIHSHGVETAVVFGLLTCGMQAAQYPFPVFLLNAGRSPVVQHSMVGGEVRENRGGPKPRTTCDGQPYAVVVDVNTVTR